MQKKIVSIVLTILFLCATSLPAFAAPAVNDNGKFSNLSGDGKYMSPTYFNNYTLDLRECTLLEKAAEGMNGLANAIFQSQKMYGYTTILVIDTCLNFDLASLLGTQIDDFQRAMKKTVFDELFMLTFCWTAWCMIGQIVRHNMVGAWMEILKVVLITCLALAFMTNSGAMLSGMNRITQSISIDLITSALETNRTAFSRDAAGTLWSVMVHRPYVDLQGGDIITDAQIDQLLQCAPGSTQRIDLVRSMNAADKQLFDLGWAGTRLGKLLTLLIPITIKTFVFQSLAVLLIVFQFLAMFLFAMASVVLLCAMVPSMGGMSIIEGWFKKVVETQIAVIALTAILALLLKLDQVLFAQSTASGWLVILIIQTFLSVYVAFKYNDIINTVTGMTHGRLPDASLQSLNPSPRLKRLAYRAMFKKSDAPKSAGSSSKSDATSPDSRPQSSSTTPTPPTNGGATLRNMQSSNTATADRQPSAKRRSYVASSGVASTGQSSNLIRFPQAAATGTDGPPAVSRSVSNTSGPSLRVVPSQSMQHSAAPDDRLKRPARDNPHSVQEPPQVSAKSAYRPSDTHPGQPKGVSSISAPDSSHVKPATMTTQEESHPPLQRLDSPGPGQIHSPGHSSEKESLQPESSPMNPAVNKGPTDTALAPRPSESAPIRSSELTAGSMHAADTDRPQPSPHPMPAANSSSLAIRSGSSASRPPSLDGGVRTNMQARAAQMRDPQRMRPADGPKK